METSPGVAPSVRRAEPGRRMLASILVVDDDLDIRESLRDLLEGTLPDVRVHLASNGEEALEILHANPADLIITDYKMPGMDGLAFLARARKLAHATPRILITAFPDLDLAIRAVNEENVEDFLTKPFDPQVVLDIVGNVLERRSARPPGSGGAAGGADPQA